MCISNMCAGVLYLGSSSPLYRTIAAWTWYDSSCSASRGKVPEEGCSYISHPEMLVTKIFDCVGVLLFTVLMELTRSCATVVKKCEVGACDEGCRKSCAPGPMQSISPTSLLPTQLLAICWVKIRLHFEVVQSVATNTKHD